MVNLIMTTNTKDTVSSPPEDPVTSGLDGFFRRYDDGSGCWMSCPGKENSMYHCFYLDHGLSNVT